MSMGRGRNNKALQATGLVALGAALGATAVPVLHVLCKKIKQRRRKSQPPMKLGYWKIRGLAQPIRLLLAYVQAPFTDECYEQGEAPDYSREEWYSVKPTLGLAFANLPYLVDGDVKLTQSHAILRYIGRKYNLLGSGEQEAVDVDMLIEELADFRKDITGLCYNPNFAQLKDAFISDKLPQRLQALDRWMAEGRDGKPRTWGAGSRLTIADFVLYDVIDNARVLATSCLDIKPYRYLKEFMLRFESIPEVADYMASDRYMNRPLNNKVASFK